MPLNIFSQFFKSLYSPKHIASYRFQGIGKTIFFAFFLALLSILPTSIYTMIAMNEGIDETAEALKTKFPAFEIKNGTLYSDDKQPVVLQEGDIEVQFDSTGTVKKEDLNDSSLVVIAMLKNEIVFKANGNTQTLPYSMFDQIVVDNEKASNFVKTAQSSIYIITGLVLFITFLFTSAVQFLEITLLAYIGQIFLMTMNRRATFGQLWRIATYSFTLAITFFTIMSAFQVPVVGDFYVKWFITIVMIYLAIKEMPVPKEKQTTIS